MKSNYSDDTKRIIPEDVLGIMRYTYVFKKHEKRDIEKKNFVYITPELEFNCLLYYQKDYNVLEFYPMEYISGSTYKLDNNNKDLTFIINCMLDTLFMTTSDWILSKFEFDPNFNRLPFLVCDFEFLRHYYNVVNLVNSYKFINTFDQSFKNDIELNSLKIKKIISGKDDKHEGIMKIKYIYAVINKLNKLIGGIE